MKTVDLTPGPKIDPVHAANESDLAIRKTQLLNTARSIDYLAVLRAHPFTTVGFASLAGVVLGSGRGANAARVSSSARSILQTLVPIAISAVRGIQAGGPGRDE
jgi:hypothetical protein